MEALATRLLSNLEKRVTESMEGAKDSNKPTGSR